MRRIGILAVVMSLMMALTSLTACTELTNNKTTVEVFEGEKIEEAEAKLYLFNKQYDTESSNYDTIISSYGDVMSYWNNNFYGITYLSACRSTAIEALNQTKVLNKYAASEGITLTAEEQAKVTAAVETMMTERAKVVELAGADKALVEKFVTENAIANKAYNHILESVDSEIDPASVLAKRVEGVYVSAAASITEDKKAAYEKGEELPEEDSSASIEISDEERLATLNQTVDDIYDKVTKDGMSYDDIETEYANNPYVTVYSLGEFSAPTSKVQPDEDGEVNKFYDFVYNIPEGEIQKAVLDINESSTYGYVMHNISADDAEFRQDEIDSIMTDRKEETFTNKITELNEGIKELHVYEEVWENITIKEGVYSE